MARIKRILLECTHTYETNLNTGIQRVVRNIVNESKRITNELGLEHQPIIVKRGYFLAADKIKNSYQFRTSIVAFLKNVYKKFRPILQPIPYFGKLESFLFFEPGWLTITIYFVLDVLLLPAALIRYLQYRVITREGDLLLMLDSSWAHPVWPAIKRAKDNGTRVGVIIYDLIAIIHPQLFTQDLAERFRVWLSQAVDNADFFIAISQTTRDEVRRYAESNRPSTDWHGRFESFQLGSVIDNIERDGKVREELKNVFECGDKAKTYLTVGTIEPRKNHKYLLDAFDEVWQQCAETRLCIVGRIGWLCTKLLKRIRSHPQYMNRLFMFNDVSDTELDYCYSHAKALVLPSLAEGFGLPLVEALYHGQLVLASDIPIFREVGKDFCAYFDISKPTSLAKMVIDIEKKGKMPKVRKPETYQLPDWKDTCRELLTKSTTLYEKASG
jgi:alpha-1,2-rhamnosyltransferase